MTINQNVNEWITLMTVKKINSLQIHRMASWRRISSQKTSMREMTMSSEICQLSNMQKKCQRRVLLRERVVFRERSNYKWNVHYNHHHRNSYARVACKGECVHNCRHSHWCLVVSQAVDFMKTLTILQCQVLQPCLCQNEQTGSQKLLAHQWFAFQLSRLQVTNSHLDLYNLQP